MELEALKKPGVPSHPAELPRRRDWSLDDFVIADSSRAQPVLALGHEHLEPQRPPVGVEVLNEIPGTHPIAAPPSFLLVEVLDVEESNRGLVHGVPFRCPEALSAPSSARSSG